jgi:ankyrin repeat protein
MKKTIFTVAAFSMLALSSVSATELKTNDFGISIEMVSPDELSSFCKAVMQGDVETVKKFIELGEDVNQKSLGKSPIHYAARYNKAEVLKVLIENGADLKKRCDGGMTAMKYAKLSNATEAQAVLEAAMKK